MYEVTKTATCSCRAGNAHFICVRQVTHDDIIIIIIIIIGVVPDLTISNPAAAGSVGFMNSNPARAGSGSGSEFALFFLVCVYFYVVIILWRHKDVHK